MTNGGKDCFTLLGTEEQFSLPFLEDLVMDGRVDRVKLGLNAIFVFR